MTKFIMGCVAAFGLFTLSAQAQQSMPPLPDPAAPAMSPNARSVFTPSRLGGSISVQSHGRDTKSIDGKPQLGKQSTQPIPILPN
jgi:hypothetical protein